MDTFLDYKINKIKLHNESGTVCILKCYYKINKWDMPIIIGETDKFPLAKNKTLNLNTLSIPKGAWVTAYADVDKGRDSKGEIWVKYDNNNLCAEFVITGTTFSSNTAFFRISLNDKTIDKYSDLEIDKIKLNNQSGTVCYIKCLYKLNMSDEPKNIGKENYFSLGKYKTLNLNTLSIPDGAWVTAFAFVKWAISDPQANIWFKYKKNCNQLAEFTISGVINYNKMSLNQITHDRITIGTFEGYKIKINKDLDHTYVYIKSEEYAKSFDCLGRDKGGILISSGEGLISEGERIAGKDGNAKISYLMTGVCHQIANRILYPAQITVFKAKGYALSTFFYGPYGHYFNYPDNSIFINDEAEPYFDEIRKLRERYINDKKYSWLEKRSDEFLALSKHLGVSNNGRSIDNKKRSIKNDNMDDNMDDKFIKRMIKLSGKERTKLKKNINIKNNIAKRSGKVADTDLLINEYVEGLNTIGKEILEEFAKVTTDSDYKILFGYEKGEDINIIDISQNDVQRVIDSILKKK